MLEKKAHLQKKLLTRKHTMSPEKGAKFHILRKLYAGIISGIWYF